jgi:hypothetical protein
VEETKQLESGGVMGYVGSLLGWNRQGADEAEAAEDEEEKFYDAVGTTNDGPVKDDELFTSLSEQMPAQSESQDGVADVLASFVLKRTRFSMIDDSREFDLELNPGRRHAYEKLEVFLESRDLDVSFFQQGNEFRLDIENGDLQVDLVQELALEDLSFFTGRHQIISSQNPEAKLLEIVLSSDASEKETRTLLDAKVAGIFATYRKEYTEFFLNFFHHTPETTDEHDAQMEMNLQLIEDYERLRAQMDVLKLIEAGRRSHFNLRVNVQSLVAVVPVYGHKDG